MTNTEPRERVAKAINSAITDAPWQQLLSLHRDDRLDMASAAIAAHRAWLWERADDPDVIEAVARAMYPHSLIRRNGMDGSIESLLKDTEAAARMVTWALTALIGPRPGSEEK